MMNSDKIEQGEFANSDEQNNKIERSELWNNVYEVLARLDVKSSDGVDAFDRPSAATEIEAMFLENINLQIKKTLLQAYKDGFNSATDSLIAANKTIQKRQIKK